jgi:hypothetical protein
MKKIKLISLFYIIIYQVQAQIGHEVVIEQNLNKEVSFHIYSESEQILKKVDNQPETDLSSPEGLVQSHFSASNRQWVLSNFLEPKEDSDLRRQNHFDFIKRMNKDENVIRLIDKLCFSDDSNPYCYVLYLIEYKDEPFKFPTLLSLTKRENRWYIHGLPNLYKIEESIMMIKPLRLKELLMGEKIGNELANELIDKTRNDEGGLDWAKLYDLSSQWKKNKEIEKINYFINQ